MNKKEKEYRQLIKEGNNLIGKANKLKCYCKINKKDCTRHILIKHLQVTLKILEKKIIKSMDAKAFKKAIKKW